MNKLLSFFGLIKIKRAKELTARLHVHFVKSVINEVKKDFGVVAASKALQDAEEWWCEEFEGMVKLNADDVNITQEPKFAEINYL